MRRAAAGSAEVSALIEFRLLKRKCGVSWARSARSSACAASDCACAARVSATREASTASAR